MTLEKATELCLKNTLFYGTMMLKMGDADAMVAGAINTTGDVLRRRCRSSRAPGHQDRFFLLPDGSAG